MQIEKPFSQACENNKNRAAGPRVASMNGRVAFFPMAFEAVGGWGPTATVVFKNIAIAATRHQTQVPDGEDLEIGEALNLLYSQLSCRLQTSLGKSIATRSPHHDP